MKRRVHNCWLEVFDKRVKELEKINKTLPSTLWNTELLTLAAADKIDELEEKLEILNNA